jgi:hypothetical protein
MIVTLSDGRPTVVNLSAGKAYPFRLIRKVIPAGTKAGTPAESRRRKRAEAAEKGVSWRDCPPGYQGAGVAFSIVSKPS